MRIGTKEIKNKDEFDYAVKKIEEWFLSESESLNIITVPYNSTLIFKDIILKLIREKGKILYIWNGKGEKKKLIQSIRAVYKNITYEYIEDRNSSRDIVFVNYRYVDDIKGDYDLVIYDDISFYSSLNKQQIKGIYIRVLKKFKKTILYSSEKTGAKSELYLSQLSTDKPFVEPRIINTRINLNKDIPCILYDYLKWFRDSKKKVLLLVPKEENAECIYDYYTNMLKMSGVKVFKLLKDNSESIKNEVLKVKNKSIFLITNNMEVILKDLTVDDAVILFSDDASFSYKKFLYICAYVGNINRDMPEVLLVSRDTSLDMDMAKDMGRNFNKLIWEKKLR